MSEAEKAARNDPGSGVLAFLWQRKSWWLLPLIVLVVLIVILYVLGHLSAADPEMYPTTQLTRFVRFLSC